MVEAAGIEPASASDPNEGATCVVDILRMIQKRLPTNSFVSLPQLF
jgi:hypothetical protein